MKKKTRSSDSIIVGLLFSSLTFLTRLIYLIILQYDRLNTFVKWMPFQHHKRALDLLSTGQTFFGNAWGSFYLVLAGEYALFNLLNIKSQIFATVVSNIILTSIAVYFFYQLSVKLFSQTQAALSTFLLILYFPLIYFNGLIANESLFFLLLIGGMSLLNQSYKSNQLKKLFFAGFLIGLAVSIRSILVSFIPLASLWLIRQNLKSTLKKLTSFIFGMLLPIILFSGLNYHFSHQHQFQLSGSTGINFAITQCHYKKVTYKTSSGETFWFSPPFYHHLNLEEIKTTTPFYHQSFYLKTGLNCLLNQKANLFKNSQNIFNLFDSILYPDFNMTPYKDQLLNISKTTTLITFVLFLLYPLTTKPEPFYHLCLLLILSLFISVYLANPGEERYLVPYTWTFFLFAPSSLLKLKKELTK